MVTKSDFRRWQKQHPNFMTPHVISLEQKGNYFIELSEGTDFEHKPLYGVSTIIFHPEYEGFTTSQDDAMKGVFSDKSKARELMRKIKSKL